MKRVPIPAQGRLSVRQPFRKLECKGLRIVLDAVRHVSNLEPFHLLALRVGVVRDVEGTITNVGRGIDVLDIHGAPSGDDGATVSWLIVAAREVLTTDATTDGIVLVRACRRASMESAKSSAALLCLHLAQGACHWFEGGERIRWPTRVIGSRRRPCASTNERRVEHTITALRIIDRESAFARMLCAGRADKTPPVWLGARRPPFLTSFRHRARSASICLSWGGRSVNGNLVQYAT